MGAAQMTMRDDAIKKLQTDLDGMRRSVIGYDGPTDERIRQARHDAVVVDFDDPLIVGDDGRPTNATVPRKRVKMLDDPLERLIARNMLFPGDDVTNEALGNAARRYRQLHRNGGGEPLKAQDPAKPFVPSGSPAPYFRSEWQIDEFAKWVEAREAIASAFQNPFDNLVLWDKDLEEIGRTLTYQRSSKQRTAVALFCVIQGVKDVALHFGMWNQKDRT